MQSSILTCLILTDPLCNFLSQSKRSYDPASCFCIPFVFAMLFFVIFICLCALGICAGKCWRRRRHRRRFCHCRWRAGRRCSWPKRPKVRQYIRCLQIGRLILLMLLKSFGSSMVSASTHDICQVIYSQRAVSRFLNRFSCCCRQIHYDWALRRVVRNRLVHALNGNMYFSVSSRGRGKGQNKGKQGKVSSPSENEDSFFDDIRASLSQAALQRMQPRLFSEDWSVPVRSAHELSSQPGVAVIPRNLVPSALRQVGYTRNPVAILTTQTAAQMNMRGYPCESILCRFAVLTDDGVRKEIQVQRQLIQLGFGAPVTMLPIGDRIDMPQTMLKAVVKLPSAFGWTADTIRGNTISNLLSQHIEIQGIEGIQCREDGSATLMLHESLVDTFLSISGKDSMFTKLHSSDEAKKPSFLLWLPENTSLQSALDMTNADTLGVVAKNSKVVPRLALRFKDEQKLAAFAQAHNLPDSSKCGRWRIDGLAPSIGPAGIVGLLQSKGWQINEFLYVYTLRIIVVLRIPCITNLQARVSRSFDLKLSMQ